MLDAILLEQQGVPAVAIITEPFHDTARAMAESWGLPGFRFVEMPHPIANLDPKQLEARADALAEAVIDLLGSGVGRPQPEG